MSRPPKKVITEVLDKLGNPVQVGDTVAFVYHGSGADLKIGKVLELKLSTRKALRAVWAFVQIVGVSENEYEDTQWCLPLKMLKLNDDMLSDVLLAKLSTVNPGRKENIDLLPQERIDEIKLAFAEKGLKVRYRCKDRKQILYIDDPNWKAYRYDRDEARQAQKVVIEEVCDAIGIPISKNKWSYHKSIRLNP